MLLNLSNDQFIKLYIQPLHLYLSLIVYSYIVYSYFSEASTFSVFKKWVHHECQEFVKCPLNRNLKGHGID